MAKFIPLWQVDSCHHSMARPYLAGGGDPFRHVRLLRIWWINSREQPTRGGPPAWGRGNELTTPNLENVNILRIVQNYLVSGLILSNDVNKGKWICDLERRM